MEKKWYQVIFDNWSQIAVILGVVGSVIGFVIKTVATFLLKKKEITFSRLQENTIQEIKTYYMSYSALIISLRNFLEQMKYDVVRRQNVPQVDLQEYKMQIEEIYDNQSHEIYDSLINYQCSAMTIRLFLEYEDKMIIENISETLYSIESDIRDFYQKVKSSDFPKDSLVLETIVKDKFLQKLPDLIEQIENNLRKRFELK